MNYDEIIQDVLLKIKNNNPNAEFYFNTGKNTLLGMSNLTQEQRNNLQQLTFNSLKSDVNNPANSVRLNAIINAKTPEELEKAINGKK